MIQKALRFCEKLALLASIVSVMWLLASIAADWIVQSTVIEQVSHADARLTAMTVAFASYIVAIMAQRHGLRRLVEGIKDVFCSSEST